MLPIDMSEEAVANHTATTYILPYCHVMADRFVIETGLANQPVLPCCHNVIDCGPYSNDGRLISGWIVWTLAGLPARIELPCTECYGGQK